MSKPLLNRNQYDHPEYFDDEIRAYKSSTRYIPTPLESLLFELAGHRCTICHAPWLEIHHIEELQDGGVTEYENLIVLCPNCHTRVHAEGIPSKDELKHYKIKQEIAYELPIFSRLTSDERDFVRQLASKLPEDQLVFSKRVHKNVKAKTPDQAVEFLKREVGYFHLQESAIVAIDLENILVLTVGEETSVSLRIKLTGKGVKWLRYLNETHRVPS